MRPICKQCGVHSATRKGTLSNGNARWGRLCSPCAKTPYAVFKKDNCELCGFIPVNRVQLDIDHIDGNNSNNDESNLQTLCANCHRLKTYLNSDWEDKEIVELKSLQMELI